MPANDNNNNNRPKMTKKILSRTVDKTYITLLAAFAMLILSSCDALHEHLQPCPQGLRLRFVFDYNMEFANSFHRQVDCLTVLFYDAQGNHVETRTATPDELADESWRMTLDLDPGTYTVLAYGGMDCDNSSFLFGSRPEETQLRDIMVNMHDRHFRSGEGQRVSADLLHPHYHGLLEVGVPEESTTYTEATVEMVRNTNGVRVLLQSAFGEPLDEADFDFRIEDNNTRMAWDNSVLRQESDVQYHPWTRGNASAGQYEEGSEAQVVYAEMSMPRLVTTNNPRLVVTRHKDGETIIDIPLLNYLMLLKSGRHSDMGNQEYLDRENHWDMIFFLDRSHTWLRTRIVINDWVVRINEGGF